MGKVKEFMVGKEMMESRVGMEICWVPGGSIRPGGKMAFNFFRSGREKSGLGVFAVLDCRNEPIDIRKGSGIGICANN